MLKHVIFESPLSWEQWTMKMAARSTFWLGRERTSGSISSPEALKALCRARNPPSPSYLYMYLRRMHLVVAAIFFPNSWRKKIINKSPNRVVDDVDSFNTWFSIYGFIVSHIDIRQRRHQLLIDKDLVCISWHQETRHSVLGLYSAVTSASASSP